jgi:putative transposase
MPAPQGSASRHSRPNGLHQVTLDFSRPGKPTDNALVESFNGRLREECLNTNWFLSLGDARRKIEAWREHYNERADRTLRWATFHPGNLRNRPRGTPAMNSDYSLRKRTKIRKTLRLSSHRLEKIGLGNESRPP